MIQDKLMALLSRRPADFSHPFVTYVATGDKEKVFCVFGYSISYIPDFLTDHTLFGDSDHDRAVEILDRWVQFIRGLRKRRGTAFALRYLSDPGSGQIASAMLGRVIAERSSAEQVSELAARELAANLQAFGLPHRSMDHDALNAILSPFAQPPMITEVRQHEEVTPLLTVNQDAYVVHPYSHPAGAWVYPFETLLRQTSPVTISIYLEPTECEEIERERLFQAAHIGQSLADQEVQVFSNASLRRRRDPQAELVGKVYSKLLRELIEPYLVVTQVASPDLPSALAVSRAIGAAIVARQERQPIEEGDIPTGFDLHVPKSTQEQQAALQCFSHLALIPWQTELASPDKKRLVYLTGANGAAAAFRFPIGGKGGIPGITVRQQAPDFEFGPRPSAIGPDEIGLGISRRGAPITIKLHELVRHAFITGFTGSGKTNTILLILDQLWAERKRGALKPIPFLVIEAAKKEYRGLLGRPGFEELVVLTLGDETTSPFRLNPFQLLPGVRVEAHINKLQTCFDAALPQFGILPSIIGESLELVYRDKGWLLSDKGGSESPRRLFPTLRDLYEMVIRVAESRGYAGETYHNIRAAAAGRIGSLLRGSRGRMFTCQHSLPVEMLLSRPVVLELNDLSQQDKALTMMFLLMLLREYRELHASATIQHVTVLEEAHNVLENVKSVGASEVVADTRAKAVEAFASMLAEVRAYGESIIISDQSPEKLAPDAIRNTNLQIAHQLRHRDDREAISAAMIMDQAQEIYLGKLAIGEAAIFKTGFDRATFMTVPNYKDEVMWQEPSDNDVRTQMMTFRTVMNDYYLPFDGCQFCGQPCAYREAIEPYMSDRELIEQFNTAILGFEKYPEGSHRRSNWRLVIEACLNASRAAGHPLNPEASWCFMTHGFKHPFTAHMRQQFMSAYDSV